MSKSNQFIERSIMGALSFLKESVFADEYALKKGLLQALDPRVKTVTFVLFIIQVLVTKSFFVLACLYGVCLLMVVASRIPVIFFLKRTWVFIPLFSLCIAIPAVFSVFTPGEALVSMRIGGVTLVVTRQGLYGALLFVGRVTASVSFAVLLSITTRHFELLRVLRIFRVPQVFVMTIGMCYRYVYLFVDVIENSYRALKSRAGVKIHHTRGQRLVTWNIASLWSRSYALNEDVYRAMLSRGYKGEPVVLQDFKTRVSDWLWLLCMTALCAGIWYGKSLLKV